jgi:hypothetical protein
VSSNPEPVGEPEVTWEQVIGSIGEQFWKLAPAEYAASRHRDLKFAVNWQDLIAAVDAGIADCYPETPEAKS